MFDKTKNRTGKGSFQAGGDLLASAAAVGGAFYLAPQLYHLSIHPALNYAGREFGYGWDWALTPVWFVGCVIATFGFCQMVTALTLKLGLAKAASLIFRN